MCVNFKKGAAQFYKAEDILMFPRYRPENLTSFAGGGGGAPLRRRYNQRNVSPSCEKWY